ncbi:MAG: DoxX family protein [Bacteroides sp.]|nr:DoxX family protein [Roseburia sp.]MCM1346351.1 DoxX family protein [Bacteroides sp.]MCM1420286.1 DoxX family protein [Bacteroides sp.]
MMKKFLFPSQPSSTLVSVLLLSARVILGVLLLNHGVEKWASYTTLADTFPDPLHIGGHLSLILVIFAELICSVAFMFGFLYRLAMIPMIISMAVAFFVVHAADPMSAKELAFVYLVSFVLLYVAGPGRYSIDYMFCRRCTSAKEEELDLVS